MHTNESQITKLLAVAIVEKPRGTLKDLAEASGISKATLHRLYGTRENLEKSLADQVQVAMEQIVALASMKFVDYRSAIEQLVGAHYEKKELLRVVSILPRFMEPAYWEPYTKALDSFFLSGQQEGTFRVDLGAQTLTELFMATICGVIDAERRGRVASSVLCESARMFFLNGALRTS